MSSIAQTAGRTFDLDQYLGVVREEVTDEIRRIMPSSRHDGGLYNLVLDYPLRHGKSLRPALCLAVCQVLGGTREDALPTAAVLELYHNAFLIHDDVEDRSLQRRNETTLHEKFGVPIAVNVGDAILAMSMMPLLDNMEHLGLGRAIRILETVARMATESAEGQNLELDWIFRRRDIPTARDYTRIVYKKTCWYSFIAPMEAGALVVGARPSVIRRLRRFAIHLGIAFQIIDDVLNLEGEAEEYGKEIDGDLWEGKYTLMLIHAIQQASSTEQARATDILSRMRAPRELATDNAIDKLIEVGLLQSGDRTHALSVIASGQNYKTSGDVHFLRGLIDQHDGRRHALAFAEKHALRARRQWHSIFGEMPASHHLEFIQSLLGYVLERNR